MVIYSTQHTTSHTERESHMLSTTTKKEWIDWFRLEVDFEADQESRPEGTVEYLVRMITPD